MLAKPSNSIVALWLWYHGGPYRGYQVQPDGPTVQATVLEALTRAGFSRKPTASGRTDAGVHARMQVLSMRVVEGVPAEAVAQRLNAVLPAGVGVVCSRPAPPKFNATWAAAGKTYRYRFLTADRPEWAPYAWRVEFDLSRLGELLPRFEGTRDFSAFHDGSSAARPRTVHRARLRELGGGLWEAEFVGDGFAKYMIRFMLGALAEVVAGRLPLEVLEAALEEARPFVRCRAPAQGLTLWDVAYPKEQDPFDAATRTEASGLPRAPPFFA